MKTTALFLVLLFAVPSIWAETFVTLESSDNKTFKIPLAVAQKSYTIKDMIADFGGPDELKQAIHFKDIDAKTLGRVIGVMKLEPETNLVTYLDKYWNAGKDWKEISTPELAKVIKAIDFLDVRSQRPQDLLNATARFFGDRIFGNLELAKLDKIESSESYDNYVKQNLIDNTNLEKIVMSKSFRSIGRIIFDDAIAKTNLAVAQIIEYIDKNQIPNADKLTGTMRDILQKSYGKDFASKIRFGPWRAYCIRVFCDKEKRYKIRGKQGPSLPFPARFEEDKSAVAGKNRSTTGHWSMHAEKFKDLQAMCKLEMAKKGDTFRDQLYGSDSGQMELRARVHTVLAGVAGYDAGYDWNCANSK